MNCILSEEDAPKAKIEIYSGCFFWKVQKHWISKG